MSQYQLTVILFMTKFLRIRALSVIAMCLPAVFALGQSKISGTVKDRNGEPLGYATVFIPKSSFGARVSEQGSYQIDKVPSGSYKLVASFMGYIKVEKDITISGDNQIIDFTMYEDTTKNEVIVTGTVNPKTALESSISISTIKADQISQSAPRSTAEILRSVPGVRSEASAGEGNTNITVRGVPIATGGSKFLLMYEDGLPVLQFGDIAFATPDIFLRADATVGRIEALRGGSASTLASNSPAGIINFISKTGSTQGGSVAQTMGVDYRNYRTDFEYGAPLANNWTFHVGGFYRQGDGPRKTNMTSSNGGQIKANLTKFFDKGYARIYLKFLNDRTPAYMPMPIQVSGTNANPTWSSLPGFDALHGALQSPYLMSNIGTGADGQLRRSNVANGMNPVSASVGSEFSFDLGEGWNLMNKTRFSLNSGVFTAPFPAEVGTINSLGTAIGGPGFKLNYAGTNESVPVNANGNGLLMRMHLFDVDLNNFNNFTNDFNINKTIDKVKINAGIYKAHQNISMSWLWNSYLTDVSDKGSRPVDIKNAGDSSLTDNGVLAYGVPAWGNCCHRNYDTQYDITAPYAGVEITPTEKLTLDVSARWDYGQVTGSFAGGDAQTKAMDVNGDGEISLVEQKVATVNNSNVNPVNYDYNYLSYSLGANYKLNETMAVFARHSLGGRANADRLLFGPYILPNGKAASGLTSDMVRQTEAGYKIRKNEYTLNATAFLANLEEQNFEATTQKTVNRSYQAFGLELDGTVNIKSFSVRGGFTYTKAEIKKDEITKTAVGKTPRRQAPIIFQLVPSYTWKNHSIGVSVIGTGKSYTQDDNKLVMPAYAYVNAFINFAINKSMTWSFNGNNLFNQIGITEAEEGSITEGQNNIIRGRSIAGRSITSTLRITF